MTRTLKAFGLVLVAAFAMSAMVTATASAQAPMFTAANYPATLTATTEYEIGDEEEYFEAIGRKVECEVAHFSGSATEATDELTITPDYTDHTQEGNCRAGGTLVTTVTENGCDYVFTLTGTDGSGPHYKVGVDVVCPPEKTIVVHVRNVINTTDACTITIHSQTVQNDLTAANNNGHVDISGTVGVKSTVHSNNTLLCGVESGTTKEVTTNYVINKPVTVKGSSAISMSD